LHALSYLIKLFWLYSVYLFESFEKGQIVQDCYGLVILF